MVLRTFAEAIAAAGRQKRCRTVAVAVPEDSHTLEAVCRAADEGYVNPILIGSRDRILTAAGEAGGLAVDERCIIDVADPLAAADKAVALVREGKADFIMKGRLNTAEMMRAVLHKETGLPRGKLITDIAITELPKYHKLLVFADGGMIPYPTLEQKAEMIRMCVDALHALGYGDDIKVGILCAAETPSPKIAESMEAVELKRMNQAGEIAGCIVEGPISLDLALIPEVAKTKRFESPCAGDVDVLIMPNLVTGNVFSKAIELYGATPLGIMMGASCPITATSRGASAELKYRALVMAAMLTK